MEVVLEVDHESHPKKKRPASRRVEATLKTHWAMRSH